MRFHISNFFKFYSPRCLNLFFRIKTLGSPIWDPEFNGKTPAHVIAAAQAQAEVSTAAAALGKKRPHDDDSKEPEAKRRRSEDENLDEAVGEIVSIIEDSKKMLGPQSMFPEHAPR